MAMSKYARGSLSTWYAEHFTRKSELVQQVMRQALELVVFRGQDVIAIRHLRDGSSVWLGQVENSIAKISMADFGGQEMLLAETSDHQFLLNIPPHARARSHGNDGLGRLIMGPKQFSLQAGDKVVIILGTIQIQVQIVPIFHFTSATKKRFKFRKEHWWVAAAVLYAVVMAIILIWKK